jgi:hypothetical protein
MVILEIGYYALWAGLAYFVWNKIIKMYFKYFYYTSQGMPSVGFPLPLVGNGLQMGKAMMRLKDVKWTLLEEFWNASQGYKPLPPVLVDFVSPRGFITISDPEVVNELYMAKNKYMEKS